MLTRIPSGALKSGALTSALKSNPLFRGTSLTSHYPNHYQKSIISRSFTDHKDPHGNILPIVRSPVGNPVKFLPQKYDVLHERFGKYVSTHQSGLNVFFPFINELIYVITTENVYAVTHQEAITKDNVSVKADGIIYYKILDSHKAAYSVSDLPRALENLVVTSLRTIIGDMELDALLSGRLKINHDLKINVGPAAKDWGVEVTRVEIREIKPDHQLVKAMDQQMIAERQKRATETLAAGTKNATVLTAEGESSRLTNEAEGKKQAIIKQSEATLAAAKNEAEGRKALADADAYAREKLAEAEAKAIETIATALAKNPGTQNFFIAQKTADAYTYLAKSPNHKLLMFPSGATSMVTPLAAAAELLGLNKTEQDSSPTAPSLSKK
jgi:regulator of protease activity HflC (stomatin/prohibitin superfamily)